MTDQRPREVVEAMSYVISRHPFFAVLLFTLHNLKVTDTVKTAATDSKTIYVNPTWFNALPIEERAFVICHELLHTALNHILRAKGYVEMGFGPDMKPFSARKWNEAADYVVNPLLIAMGLTKMPVGGLLNPQFTADSLVDEVYTQLPDPDPNQDQDPGDGHGGFDQHMPAAGDAPSAAEVATAVVQAANAQKAQGDLPAGLARLVQELVSPTKNWRELLADALRVSVGRDEASWARPNRRRLATNALMPLEMPFFPGATGHAMGGVVVTVDTSGSVSDAEVRTFLSELAGILTDCRPEWIKLLWVDSAVAGVDELESPADLMNVTPKGGGGTNMPATFDWIDQEQLTPDAVVIMSDGYTPFGSAQPYPVIWALTTDRVAPHGRTIRLD